jgi:hypothetical protein
MEHLWNDRYEVKAKILGVKCVILAVLATTSQKDCLGIEFGALQNSWLLVIYRNVIMHSVMMRIW